MITGTIDSHIFIPHTGVSLMAEDNSRFDPPSEESSEWYDADSTHESEGTVESYEDDYYDSSDAFLTDDDDLYHNDGGGGPLFSGNRLVLILAVVAIIVILLLVLRACGVIGATGSDNATPTSRAATVVSGQAATTPGAELATTPAPPTATPMPPTPTPATIRVGARVEVAGTGEDGMSFRTGPGTKYIRISVLKDGDVLRVVGGPEDADGVTWWRLEAEDGAVGWAVENFLILTAG